MHVYRSIILSHFYTIRSFITAPCQLHINEVCYLILTTKIIIFFKDRHDLTDMYSIEPESVASPIIRSRIMSLNVFYIVFYDRRNGDTSTADIVTGNLNVHVSSLI